MGHSTDDVEEGRSKPLRTAGGTRVSVAEELRAAVATGAAVRRGAGESAEGGHGWTDERTLAAEVLHEVLLPRPGGSQPRAAVLVGIRIAGQLNFEAAAVQAPLIAHGCYFDAPINLIAAGAAEIAFSECHLPALVGDGLRTRGDLCVARSTLQVLSLDGAQIGGTLNLEGTTLEGGDHPVALGAGTFRPTENLDGLLDTVALAADGLQVDQDLLCGVSDGQRFDATGELRLRGAHIGGSLDFSGAHLHGDAGPSLTADVLQVDQVMSCGVGDGRRFEATGEVRLPGARIGAQLDFRGARLSADAGAALFAQDLRVDYDMSCGVDEGHRFEATGELVLTGAQIGGQLDFNAARLRNDHGSALSADGLDVGAAMVCGTTTEPYRFEATGELDLADAHIGGWLSFAHTSLIGNAFDLHLERACIDDALFLPFPDSEQDPQPRPHRIYLTRARVGWLFDSELTWPDTLDLTGFVYDGATSVVHHQEQPGRAAKHRVDERQSGRAGTSAGGQSQLNGTMEGHTVRRAARKLVGALLSWLLWRVRHRPESDVQLRLRWIRRAEESPPEGIPSLAGHGFVPQPYNQLMTVYRHHGRDDHARRVAFERERRRRSELGLPGSAWNSFLQWTVGYGYKPLRALGVLAMLIIVGTLLFSDAHNDGDLTPLRREHPPFMASIYTVDRLIPVVSLGMRDAFRPAGSAQWWAFAYTLLGWALTIAVAAGLNAAVRRE